MIYWLDNRYYAIRPSKKCKQLYAFCRYDTSTGNWKETNDFYFNLTVSGNRAKFEKELAKWAKLSGAVPIGCGKCAYQGRRCKLYGPELTALGEFGHVLRLYIRCTKCMQNGKPIEQEMKKSALHGM
jgi:hypothetical protein